MDGAHGLGQKFTNADNDSAQTQQIISFAAANSTDVFDLDAISMGVFEKALENVAFLRAQNGGGMSRLTFAADSLSVQQTNIRAALGRIEDVDIAEESSNLSKYEHTHSSCRSYGCTGKQHERCGSDATTISIFSYSISNH